MFDIAPHGKTVVATLPYADGKSVLTLTKPEARQVVTRLRELVKRHGKPEDEPAKPLFDLKADGDGIVLTYLYAARVLDGGTTCHVYIPLTTADNIANAIQAACLPPAVRKRTRSAPGAQVRVRKRIRKDG